MRILTLLIFCAGLFACGEANTDGTTELAEARQSVDPTEVSNNLPAEPITDARPQTAAELDPAFKRTDEPAVDADDTPTLEPKTRPEVKTSASTNKTSPEATKKPVPGATVPAKPTISHKEATKRRMANIDERDAPDTGRPAETIARTKPAPASKPDPTAGTAAGAQKPAPGSTTVPGAATLPDHSLWNDLLSSYVTGDGRVNYVGLKNERTKLERYLTDLAGHPPAAGWGRDEELAYWINAYNAFTVDLILKNYPLQSITDLDGGQPWKVKRIQLGDQTYSLDQIENEIIRPRFREPRIHFAVNCAAKSCPPLHNRAFTKSNLNTQLESLTRKFVNNSRYNSISANSAEVSKIFDWYGKDFGDLRAYLNRYSDAQLSEGADITYKEYDWSLNN